MNRGEGLHHDDGKIEEPGIQQAAEVEQPKPESLTVVGAEIALGKQDEALRAEEKNQDPHGAKVLTGLRKWLGIAMLSGTVSFVQMGCSPSEKSPDLDNRPRAEKLEDKEGQDKNREFLGNILENISGGEMTVKENGDAIVFRGGKFYELKGDDITKLAKLAGGYRERIEGEQDSKGMKGFVLKTRQAATLNIGVSISKIGREILIDELPTDMKNFVKSVEKIQESPKTDSGKIPDSTTAAPGANDFLK